MRNLKMDTIELSEQSNIVEIENEVNGLLINMAVTCIEQYITGSNYDKNTFDQFIHYLQDKYVVYNDLFFCVEEIAELNEDWDENCRKMLYDIVNKINERPILKEIISHFDQITFQYSENEEVVSTRVESIVNMLELLQSYSNKPKKSISTYDYNF
jgi:hypothetical protein